MQSRALFTGSSVSGNRGLLLAQRWRPSRFLHTPGLASGARGISMGSFGKILGKAVRVPTAIGGAVVGGATYVNYKVQEVHAYTTDKINSAGEWIGDTFRSIKGSIDEFEGPDFGSWFSRSESGDGSGGESTGSGGGGGGSDGGEAALAGAAAAVALQNRENELPDEEQMVLLTRKMIEIRNILNQVDGSETLQLPSIVVIGSQSSGKSSVLEAIVGHEFLPKGNNMVTRRPIELTLVNTPDSAAEYGEFPALGLGKLTDFTDIQRTLTELNLAVPDTEVVSDDPIQLRIFSPNVPDLTLIDLPGYIQVTATDQPESLKQRIAQLVDKYIQPPNVILAISAADVDLANSSALRASRRVDPRGERTIGVITKMDLVDPERGFAILTNESYPLKMGYVGVITRAPAAGGGLFRRSSSLTAVVAQNENHFFNQHPVYSSTTTGTMQLRKKLMVVLEKTMAESMQPTADNIRLELEESAYQFKVEYNDRSLTPQTYLAGSVDSFKLAFKELSGKLTRDHVRKLLKSELDQRVLDLLAQRYWNRPLPADLVASGASDVAAGDIVEPPLAELAHAAPADAYWQRKLDAAASSLTKLGVGRMSTTLVINAISNEMDELTNSTAFRNHPFARNAILEATADILNMSFYSTADQVENCIKPYKYEVEVEDREWVTSRDHAYNLLKEELRQCEDAYNGIKRAVGSGKLKQVMKFIDATRAQGAVRPPLEGTEAFGFSSALLGKGRDAVFLRDRSDILRMRMAAVKSRQCRSKENKYYCPEVFLDVVADKLTQTAVLFLNVELLSDFYYKFPRELDSRLGKNLSDEQVEALAKQDPKIKRHIELQQRKELLELALSKIENVIEIQKQRQAREHRF